MEIALLALRLVVGLGFAAHGAQKLFGAFGGYGLEGTAGFFEQIGLRPGRVHAATAGTIELFGGLLIAVGLVTPFAAAALIAVMVAATITVHLQHGFFAANNGYELNLVLAAAAFALAGIGAGEWSIDHTLGLNLDGTAWALAALGVGALGGLGAVFSGRLIRRESGHGEPHPSPTG